MKENNADSLYVVMNETDLQNINGGFWGLAAAVSAAYLAVEELGERAGHALYYAIN